jgi:hypothetical protein
MVCGMAQGRQKGKETGETALLRELLGQINPGDVLLAGRYYCSYFQIALLQEMGVDFVTRLHQCRTADFRRGRSLGKGDHIITWSRPTKPTWMDQATYDRMPESLTLRELQVQVQEPGFRVESFVVVTTLVDARKYPHDDIADLYRKRWMAELDIRAIKESMGLDVLRCKSPEMVRKELWVGLLAYNLIRQTMAQAALQHGVSPRQLSFTAALQKLAAAWCVLPLADPCLVEALGEAHRKHMAANQVGDRPNRIEPRAVKRRPKAHDLLMKPRAEARAALLINRS